MTNFFSTMINRHLGRADVVEPRPRARFEPESGSAAAVNIPVDSLEAEQNLTYRRNQNYSVAENSTEPGLNIPNKEGRFNAPIMQGQHPSVLNPVFAPWGEQRRINSPSVEAPQQITKRAKIPPAEGRRHEVPAEGIPGGAYPLRSELDNRIEALLQRLRGSQSSPLSATGASNSDQSSPSRSPEQGERGQDLNSRPRSIIPSQGGRRESSKSSEQQADSLFPGRQKIATDKNLKVTTLSTEPSPRHSGLLELPSWLAEMQAEFSRRWQKMDSRAEAEPVINVTIGRVEVRAVQTEPPKQSKRKNKPISVMGLDEYLKQRGRGRA